MDVDEDFDPKRILVVDDDGPMLRTHGRVLEAHGLRPVLMPDPGEALQEAKRRAPGVIVIDLVMPGMSGLEYVTRLRTHYGRACPPVILVSANCWQLSPLEQLMFDAVFPKPYSVDGLVTWVKRLGRQHWERRQAPSVIVKKRDLHLVDEDEGKG
jgi:DNA-binding response OmpR family regulator